MKILRQARVTTDADETYLLTRYDDLSLHVERTHSSARSPRIFDDDFIATGPLGGIYGIGGNGDVVRNKARTPMLHEGARLSLLADGKGLTSGTITNVEYLVTNTPEWNNV